MSLIWESVKNHRADVDDIPRPLFRFRRKSDIVSVSGREKGRVTDAIDEEGERNV